uniref:Aurora kinase A and ninein-interacting protein n=1 Tax=Neogobius melanostomus TaxID=47308 RepID=A0A8C6S1G4_9GOBI
MKPSKVAAQNSGQNKEDCGVWLDTVQLKGKAKKVSSGYNVAVALNFTQTKMEMPKTKQSSISNFFTGQRRESLLDAEGRISTQKTSKGLSLQNDKENTIPKSPKKTMPDSQLQIISKNTKLEPLHLKEGSLNSPFKWTKPKRSPRKKLKLQSFRNESDDENFSMLFTQDSQGFRVIAHRGSHTRSPFKDQSNVSVHLPTEIKCLEEHEDEEMLFTQDSQGNMVIKH